MEAALGRKKRMVEGLAKGSASSGGASVLLRPLPLEAEEGGWHRRRVEDGLIQSQRGEEEVGGDYISLHKAEEDRRGGKTEIDFP